jgi:hypothetical protein
MVRVCRNGEDWTEPLTNPRGADYYGWEGAVLYILRVGQDVAPFGKPWARS